MSLSKYIESQFPAIFRDGGENLIAFIEAYYEYMEKYHSKNKLSLESTDIDKTLPEFVAHFKKTYLKDFPYVSATDNRFMIKNIQDFYSSKGTEVSTSLLLKLLFGGETSIYYPGRDVLKASDSKWYRPVYIEVSRSDKTVTFIDKEIIGTRSQARALVEGIVTKRVNGKFVDVVYLSNVRGSFVRSENITVDGSTDGTPQIIGSLSELKVLNGGKNNKVGDIFDVNYENGRYGKVRVASTENATGRVDFSIVDGGTGYTVTDRTNVYVSDAVVELKNIDVDFIDFEEVYQQIERIELLATDTILGQLVVGAELDGHLGAGAKVADGRILTVNSTYDAGNDITNSVVDVLVESGSFQNQLTIKFTTTTELPIGETISEQTSASIETSSTVGAVPVIGNRVEQVEVQNYGSLNTTLTISGVLGTFVIGDTVYQNNANSALAVHSTVVSVNSTALKVKSPTAFAPPGEFVAGSKIYSMNSSANADLVSISSTPAQIYTSRAVGTITAVSGANITMDPVWGKFKPGIIINIYEDSISTTSLSTGAVDAVTVLSQGANGVIISKTNANTYIVGSVVGSFDAAKKIQGDKSKVIGTISTITNAGATDVRINNNINANAVIDLVDDRSAKGIVIGQNTSSIGIYGNTTPFYSSGDVSIVASRRELDELVFVSGNTVSISLKTNHTFTAGKDIKIEIDLKQSGEIKRLYGIYSVLNVPNSTTIRVNLEPAYASIVSNGSFVIFSGTVEETVVVPIKTKRYLMISPPRDSGGVIVEKNEKIIKVSTGHDADFRIGTIENTEIVFIDTDLIGSENIVGVTHDNIQIDAANSGVGFIDSVTVLTSGSGYSNGAIVTFTGGGYAGAPAEISATGIVVTSGAGALSDIIMTNNGQGYYTAPTIIMPGGNNTASATVNFDSGYGFPKMPSGDVDTPLELMLTSEEFTIGTIASLKNINPGSNYNANPFVRVVNPYISGFHRNDFVINVVGNPVNYVAGETLEQSIPGDGATFDFAKGFVIATTAAEVIVRRTSFNTSFTPGYPLVGVQSGYSSIINYATPLDKSRPMGDNSVVKADVIVADGVATSLEVIDSGYGYENEEFVNMTSSNSQFAITGTALVKNQGVGTGRWQTETSHLNGSAHIHDNFYYQEYSYEVVTSKSIEQYEIILKNLIHVAGNEFFGRVERITDMKTTSSITSVPIEFIQD